MRSAGPGRIRKAGPHLLHSQWFRTLAIVAPTSSFRPTGSPLECTGPGSREAGPGTAETGIPLAGVSAAPFLFPLPAPFEDGAEVAMELGAQFAALRVG